MSYINNINSNFLNGVQKKNKPQRDDFTPKAEDKKVEHEVRPETKTQVSAKDTLDYLANVSLSFRPQVVRKTVNKAELSDETKLSIADSMKQFDKVADEIGSIIDAEMPDMDVFTRSSVISTYIEKNFLA